MKFKEAVQVVPSIKNAYCPGMKALKEVDRKRLMLKTPSNITGSTDLDAALKELEPDSARWDYGIGMKKNKNEEEAIWVEVHPASAGEVKKMKKKLQWLQLWMENEAHALNQMSNRFFWVASGKVSMSPGSKDRKMIAAAGLFFAGEYLKL
jgi:hypothetical protein